jgi:hypothetical protein
MKAKKLFLAMVAVLTTFSSAQAQRVDRARVNEYGQPTQDGPSVNVWIDRYSFSYGERLRAYFQTDPGAYVTVLRVTTNGNVRVLYPHLPTVQRAFTYDLLVDDEIPYSTDVAFYLNEPPGVGVVFAIASYTPFDYRGVSSGGRWSTLRLTTSQYDDPFTIVSRFVSRTLASRAEYSVDYIQYEVTGAGRYRTRPYSSVSYDDLYFQCLTIYGPRAVSYCRSSARFGGSPYFIGRFPTTAPVPTGRTAGMVVPKMRPPRKYIPDPSAGDEGLKPKAPEPNPSGSESANAAPHVFRGRPADGERTAGDRERARRAEPADVSPSRYRIERQAPAEVRREPQYEAAPQRYERPPQPRAEPAPVGTFPRYQAPVVRSEPRENSAPVARPAPPPPPPPPPPAPATAPPPRQIPFIPPASAPVVDH